ncbi:MAG TPA: plastocyanin/azurin family copper-binding protein [Solirubrobacteraceae bacterium]|nr:plastocyanin/azurin family copper-binding protein [Solirubrobacteraceae bacterium]
MNRGIAVLLAGTALALAAGCGSSASSGSGTGSTSTSTAAPASTTSLKVATTPKYGTPPASSPAQSGTVQVAYRNIAISPDTLRVKVGSTIRWTNYDSVEHNVTTASGPQQFASKNFGEGASFEVKLTRPGTIHYRCTIHPTTMNGTIAVVR